MSQIKLLVMDVDGTLTDGHIYIGNTGEMMKAFHVKDGYAIAQMLPKMGIIPVIITGRSSAIVEQRARELNITELHQGISDKLKQLRQLMQKFNVSPADIAYIGDDLNDLECIQFCGYTGCPADAVSEVLTQVDYICRNNGGNGAVREFIEQLTKQQ